MLKLCLELLLLTTDDIVIPNIVIWDLGKGPKKKTTKVLTYVKLGPPYVPSSLVWTKKSLDKYSFVYPTYLSKKFGHFGIKVCPLIHIFLILMGG